MSRWLNTLNSLKADDDYNAKTQLLNFFLVNLEKGEKFFTKEDLPVLADFIFDEMKKLLELIPKALNYKQKDKLIAYEDNLVGLFQYLLSQKYIISDENVQLFKALVLLVEDNRIPGSAIDKMFKFDKIERSDVINVLEIIKPLTDEYQRGLFYQGLLHHYGRRYLPKKIDKFNVDAENEMAKFVCNEFENYLKRGDSLTDDEINNIAIASDVCKHFINDELLNLLEKIIQLKHSCINYYAIETLLVNKRQIDPNIIALIAADLEYADMTFNLLERTNMTHLFPKEYTSPEYLAKSNMVRWLIYPTELGKAPEEIELLGTVKSEKELYYVFKYKTDSDNLEDELKNEWLIGWASNDGGTFSHFNKLSQFEQKSLKKTLKIIKKKQIG